MVVYLNGDFVDDQSAMVSVFDQGFLYGDGIYESCRSHGSHLYRFSAHYARLIQSARALRYPLRVTEPQLRSILGELREVNRLENAYYRIMFTRGQGQVGFQRAMNGDLTSLIIAREFKGFDDGLYRDGMLVRIAQTRRNAPEAINPQIKSISNLNSLLGKLEAQAAGVAEVIMLNSRGHLCEGSASNIFWCRDGWVLTPSPATGLLEGVTRAAVMGLCEKKLKLKVVEGEYRLQDLKYSDEVFLSSTSLEVMPVVQVDDFVIKDGRVGPVARRLRLELHRDMAAYG
ncbi:MAG: branched-chain amino acid aminotransferase [Desulfuromonas sp.]|nr:MAG: branched-chain amino acid aminotransferase [Desulfuromonas sp.]